MHGAPSSSGEMSAIRGRERGIEDEAAPEIAVSGESGALGPRACRPIACLAARNSLIAAEFVSISVIGDVYSRIIRCQKLCVWLESAWAAPTSSFLDHCS